MKTQQDITVVKIKRYFDKYEVYHYSDGTYSFENYQQRFNDVIKCITWGQAMNKAVADRRDALKRIKELEVDSEILAGL
jgi:hypothetical protein